MIGSFRELPDDLGSPYVVGLTWRLTVRCILVGRKLLVRRPHVGLIGEKHRSLKLALMVMHASKYPRLNDGYISFYSLTNLWLVR